MPAPTQAMGFIFLDEKQNKKSLMLKKMAVLLLAAMTITACSYRSEQDQDDIESTELTIKFKTYLKKINKEQDSLILTYMVIPTLTCPSCIENLKEYILTNKTSGYTKFILPGNSYKDVRLTFSDEILEKSNVWLDTEGHWFVDSLNDKNSAKVFYVLKGEIVKVVSLNPSRIHSQLIDLASWNLSANSFLFYKLYPDLKRTLGSQAPSINSETMNGDYLVSSSSEKIKVINFWFQNCAPCIIEMPILNRLSSEYSDSRVEFISVCRNSEEEIRTFLQKKLDKNGDDFVKFPIIHSGQDIMNNYGVKMMPLTFVVDHKNAIFSISSLDINLSESYDLSGIKSEFPNYYLMLKGHIDKAIAFRDIND